VAAAVVDRHPASTLTLSIVSAIFAFLTPFFSHRCIDALASPRSLRDSYAMFTGLIEEVGKVVRLDAHDAAKRLEIAAPKLAGEVRIGDSVAVNGCCLTAVSSHDGRLAFDLLQETFDRTNFRNIGPDSGVNLELALTAGGRLGGHFVQGHIDCAAPILALDEAGADLRAEIGLPGEFARYVACKGSIAVNGISLTIAEISAASFVVWIIPHTKAQTNLGSAKGGDLVNLEFDLLAKYVERLLDHPAPPRP
jgi:riboflavin synthase